MQTNDGSFSVCTVFHRPRLSFGISPATAFLRAIFTHAACMCGIASAAFESLLSSPSLHPSHVLLCQSYAHACTHSVFIYCIVIEQIFFRWTEEQAALKSLLKRKKFGNLIQHVCVCVRVLAGSVYARVLAGLHVHDKSSKNKQALIRLWSAVKYLCHKCSAVSMWAKPIKYIRTYWLRYIYHYSAAQCIYEFAFVRSFPTLFSLSAWFLMIVSKNVGAEFYFEVYFDFEQIFAFEFHSSL